MIKSNLAENAAYHIAIVDDNMAEAEQLKGYIDKYFSEHLPNCYEVCIYQNSNKLIWDIEDRKYFDIYFLDVEMPEQIGGLELAGRIKLYDMEPVIIYVTNYVKYAPQAFEVNAFRYIPKRMLREKITEALDCVLPKIEQMSQRTYVVEVAGGLEKILYKNIIFISKDGKYVIIHHKNGEVRERKSLSQMMDSLNAQEFVYIDKGYIVNIQQIESLRKDYVTLKNGMAFKISRSKYQCVKEKAAAYWRGLR